MIAWSSALNRWIQSSSRLLVVTDLIFVWLFIYAAFSYVDSGFSLATSIVYLIPPSWTPHSYSVMIWVPFLMLVMRKRIGNRYLASFMLFYPLYEIIWDTSYASWFGAFCPNPALPYDHTLWWFLEADLLGLATTAFFLLRNRVTFRPVYMIPFIAWVIFQWSIGNPIIFDTCHKIVIPGNVVWEIPWHVIYLSCLFFATRPLPAKVKPAYADDRELAERSWTGNTGGSGSRILNTYYTVYTALSSRHPKNALASASNQEYATR